MGGCFGRCRVGLTGVSSSGALAPAATPVARSLYIPLADIMTMVLFTEESVLIGNAFDQGTGFAGLGNIRTVIEFDRSLVTTENAITISNVEVTGNTVTWDEVWDPDESGDRYCKSGLIAVIEDGTILTWTFPDTDAVFCP